MKNNIRLKIKPRYNICFKITKLERIIRVAYGFNTNKSFIWNFLFKIIGF